MIEVELIEANGNRANHSTVATMHTRKNEATHPTTHARGAAKRPSSAVEPASMVAAVTKAEATTVAGKPTSENDWK